MAITQDQIDSIVRMRGERCSIQSIANQLELSKQRFSFVPFLGGVQ